MDRSTFNQRPASPLLDDLAIGYRYEGGSNLPYRLDYCETVPAAGLY